MSLFCSVPFAFLISKYHLNLDSDQLCMFKAVILIKLLQRWMLTFTIAILYKLTMRKKKKIEERNQMKLKDEILA